MMVLRRPEDSDGSEKEKRNKREEKTGRLFVGTDVFRVLSRCVGASHLCFSLALSFLFFLLFPGKVGFFGGGVVVVCVVVVGGGCLGLLSRMKLPLNAKISSTRF